MNLIFFAQTLLGILFVIRTNQIFRARALLSAELVTKAGTIFVSIAILTAILCKHSLTLAFLGMCANVFCSFAALFWCERRQFDALKAEIPWFLDRWILNSRLGSAPVTARERALLEQSENFRALLRPVFSAQGARARHSLLPSAILCELERIQVEPHAALARLEALRETLRKAADFRRRSGQAVRQTQIQSALMVLLMLALTGFTLQRYGWRRVSDLVVMSILLSSLGALAMHYVARKTRWKI